MALVALLVLAFANPFIRRANAGASGRLLIVVVDNSFSMRAGTRFADAKQGALQVLAAKPSGQKAQVMALGAELQVLTQPVEDAGTLRAAAEGIQQGDSKGNFGELGRGLRAMAETVHTPVELHLFSDMQRTEMPGNFADMVMPGNVKLILHSVTKAAAGPNWTVASVDAPAQIADPKDKRVSRVEAVVEGFGTPAATKVVSLVVDGKTVASKKVDVPANGRVKVELEPLDVPYGFSRCEVRVAAADGAADAFPADDASVFSVRRSDPERVLFLHAAGDTRSQVYFGAALAAAAESSFVLQPVNVEQSADVDPTRYAFVVVSDAGPLPSILENSMVKYVKDGGSVLIRGGDFGVAQGEDSDTWGGCSGGEVLLARGGWVCEGGTGGCYASGDGGCGAGRGGGCRCGWEGFCAGFQWVGGLEGLLRFAGGCGEDEGTGAGAAGGWDSAADR